jgi:UDPglucose 6-dehydrogenase
MNVTVVGSGYVGLVAAAALAEIGHNVTCIDKDAEKVSLLKQGKIPIYERDLEEIVSRNLNKRLKFSRNNFKNSFRQSDVIFIAVGTPIGPGGQADLTNVHEVVDSIAEALDGVVFQQKIVVEKSTVPVGTGEAIARRLPRRVEVVSNPEFLREGTAVTDFLYPDRIVLGTNTVKALTTMKSLYAPLLDGSYAASANRVTSPRDERLLPKLIHTTVESAELIKHSANAFLAMKISFINAVSNICERVGADIEDVAMGIGSDSRIGPRFLRAGIGYGGSCFPKDIAAFRSVADDLGYDFDLLAEVERINVNQRRCFIEKVSGALGALRGKKIAALGIAFKAGTDDVRESPALDIIRALIEEGCQITAYDPVATESAKKHVVGLENRLKFAGNPYAAAKQADAVLVLTNWDEFALMDLEKLRSVMRDNIVVDGRNLFSPEGMAELGFTYISVGRPPVGVSARRATGTAG